MSVRKAQDLLDARVTSADVAGNLRALSVRFEGVEAGGEAWKDIFSRIDQIVALFLEKHWLHPRRFAPIQPLSYMLYQGPEDETFEEDVERITSMLQQHLFGEGVFSGVEVESLVGDQEDVEIVARGSEEEFRAAHEAAQAAKARRDAKPGASGGPSKSGASEGPDRNDPPGLRATDAAWKGRLRLFAGYDAQQGAILSYVTTLALGEARTAPMPYEEFGATTGAETAQFEFEALRHTVLTLIEQSRSGVLCNCLVPLSYETLADRRAREAYLELCKKVPEHLRRYIVPTVFATPPGPSSSFLMEIIGAIRPTFKLTNWQTQTCAIDPEPLKHAKIFGVTLSLPGSASKREAELTRLPTFVRQLASHKLSAGVSGVADYKEVAATIQAGVRFLSGAGVSTAMTELKPRANVNPGELPIS